MIAGIGTDLVEIVRIQGLLNRSSSKSFLDRVLTPAEQTLAARKKNNLAEFAAGRFAAKEAVSKALGCGIGGVIGFQDIEVIPDAAGRPICTISPEAAKRAGLSNPYRIHISITHSQTTAAAFAIIENT